MSPEQAREMIAVLADHFQMRRVPTLDVGTPVTGLRAINRAWASPAEWRIYINKRMAKDKYEYVLCHEFAHLLAHRRYGVRHMGKTRRKDWHGPHFVDTLLDVARAWYGDAKLYPWAKEEYVTVRKMGEAIA